MYQDDLRVATHHPNPMNVLPDSYVPLTNHFAMLISVYLELLRFIDPV